MAATFHHRERRLEGLFRFAGIVADQRQPRQRHRDGQLHRRAEGHDLAEVADDGGVAAEEDYLAQNERQHKQRRHGDLVDPAEVGDTDDDPHNDQRADHKAPHSLS